MVNNSHTLKSVLLVLILGILFLSQSTAAAGQVVITPDKIEATVFRTSDAICYGANDNTHINLGFGTSVTGTDGDNYSFCTVGGGWYNTASADYATIGGGSYNIAFGPKASIGGGATNIASADYSTVGGGFFNTANGDWATVGGGNDNTASHNGATVGGGQSNRANGYTAVVGGGYDNIASGYSAAVGGGGFNTAGGEYSWAGGKYMQLEDTADHTFVWGHREYDGSVESISTANAFLIFPIGTSGKVGIGTKTPHHLLDLGDDLGKKLAVYQNTNNSSFYGFGIAPYTLQLFARAGSSDNPAMVIRKEGVSDGDGNVGIGTGTDAPKYKLDVIGDIRATGDIYYGGTSGTAGDEPYIKPDYVFEKGYEILSTEQVAQHLENEKSLPWITSLKKEKEENGEMVDMTRMSFETVETVENLQLQIIAMSDIIKKQQKMIEKQNELNQILRKEKDAIRTENNALSHDINRIKEALGIL